MKENDLMPELMTRSIDLPNGHEGKLTIFPYRVTWGEGSIVAPELTQQQLQVLTQAATSALVVVPEDQLKMSGCTDGRNRLGLLDGSEAPIWQKTVGTDLLVGFAMAEAVGGSFYGAMIDKPVMDRIRFFADFMKDNGDMPTAHEGCGARMGFPVIQNNVIRFTRNNDFRQQIKMFGGKRATDENIEYVTTELKARNYTGWNPDDVRDMVIAMSGEKAVKKLEAPHDHPNHGHEEFLRVRLTTPGIAFSARKYIDAVQQTDDPVLRSSNAFSNNDDRIERLASMIADNPAQEEIALTAGLLYSESGWATLGDGQYIIQVTDSEQ